MIEAIRPNYLTVAVGVAQVESSDGKKIPTNYLTHPRFRSDCDFCAGLNYMFVRFVPDRSYSKGYEVRKGINLFLDYVVQYEDSNDSALHLSNLLHINSEIFLGFDLYLKKTRGPAGLATRLKSALTSVAFDNDEGMPLLVLPAMADPPGKASVPLNQTCYDQLSIALRSHIDSLYEKLVFRTLVELAAPYEFSEILAQHESAETWTPSIERSLKTLLHHGHPFSVALDSFIEIALRARGEATPTSVVEIIYRRFNPNKARNPNVCLPALTIDELLRLYYPTAIDQTAIVFFLSLQTGWNKETVMAIDGENFEHPLTGAIATNQTLISSEKHKSQSARTPYFTPKTFLAASNRSDKYSAYSLICLAKELSLPFIKTRFQNASVVGSEEYKPLFSCIRGYREMRGTTRTRRPIGRFSSVGSKSIWRLGAIEFLERYEIYDNGRRLIRAADLDGRLRPTWVRFVRDRLKRPLSVVALLQGHAAIETTDVHYDSSGPALAERRARLRTELNQILDLLRERTFKGLVGIRGIIDKSLGKFRLFTIPGHERILWACMNSFHPDWPGSSIRITNGSKCTEISECLQCSQVCVTEDSLPFLMRRQEIIQQEIKSQNNTMFETRMADELKILDYLLNELNEEKAVKAAARYLRQHPDLLPTNMRDLSILFED